MSARPAVLVDPHLRRMAEILSPADEEAIARGLPPQRLQIALPETVARFASVEAGKPPPGHLFGGLP
ncbi:MAG: hypothetical protein QME94_09140, partial [Anaerolineae bacterium]|nr:hypothetical protein [Anaerolineae bacterium]